MPTGIMVLVAPMEPLATPAAADQGDLRHVEQTAAMGRIIVGAKEAIAGWVAKAVANRPRMVAVAMIHSEDQQQAMDTTHWLASVTTTTAASPAGLAVAAEEVLVKVDGVAALARRPAIWMANSLGDIGRQATWHLGLGAASTAAEAAAEEAAGLGSAGTVAAYGVVAATISGIMEEAAEAVVLGAATEVRPEMVTMAELRLVCFL